MTQKLPLLRWMCVAICALALGWAQAQVPAAPAVAVSTAAPPAAPDTLISATSLSGGGLVAPLAERTGSGNPYGLQSVWQQGDAVARITLGLLGLMSLLSWYIIIAKWLAQRRMAAQTQVADQLMRGKEPFSKHLQTLPPDSGYRVLQETAQAALQRHASLAGQVELATWLSQEIVQAVAALQLRAQNGLSLLATVGATAPFVGLFGTVWGIYNALVTIGVSGQASIDKVAGPVGEALIMTALGLAVAVPAVLGYNWLVRQNRVALHQLRQFASELHTQLLEDQELRQRANAVTQYKFK